MVSHHLYFVLMCMFTVFPQTKRKGADCIEHQLYTVGALFALNSHHTPTVIKASID